MARCLLISFSGYPTTPSSLMPDNGLASLAGALLEAGHEVLLRDLNTIRTMSRLYPPRIGEAVRPMARAIFCEGATLPWRDKVRLIRLARQLERHQAAAVDALARDLVREALPFKPDLVGLKLWNGDGFTGSIRMARHLRAALPEVPIAAGGPHVAYFGEHIHDYTDAFDVLIRGDGERAVVQLCEWAEGVRSAGEVEGAIWRCDVAQAPPPGNTAQPGAAVPHQHLDDTPLPVYDLAVYPDLWGDEKIRIGVLEESRGCPERCSFCIHPVKSGGRWRVKSAPRVLREIDQLCQALKSNTFIYAGSNTPARAAVDYAKGVLERGWHLRYGCFGHTRGMRDADFGLLKRSGCEAIFYGIESGSARILREAFHKSASVDDISQSILATKAAGIFTVGSVIFPAPFETAESRDATLQLLKELRPDSVPVTAPGVIPGTPWHLTPERFGIRFSARRDLYAYGLTYKIRLLFPPRFWRPLPYTLNGKSSREFLKETTGFIEELEGAGLLTNVSHELALMAEVVGRPVREFRNEARTAFFSRDVEWAARLVETANAQCAVRNSPVPVTAHCALRTGH